MSGVDRVREIYGQVDGQSSGRQIVKMEGREERLNVRGNRVIIMMMGYDVGSWMNYR